MLYIRYPLSLRQVEDLLFERGIDICHETMRFWWNRFGPLFAAEIRKRRFVHHSYSNWRWHLDEVFVLINGETHYLWRAVDHEGEVLEVFVTKRRDRRAALQFLKRPMKRHGQPKVIVTDRLRSYCAAMNVIGNGADQECGRWLNNRAENSHQPFRRREGAMSKFWDVKTLLNSLPSMPRSTIILISTVISTAAKPSKKIALPRWPNGWCEFSTRLLSQRLQIWSVALPITFIAARYDRSLSVKIDAGRPYRFIARLRNWSAAYDPAVSYG